MGAIDPYRTLQDRRDVRSRRVPVAGWEMLIQITTVAGEFVIDALKVQYKQACLHCGIVFLTTDPAKLHCKPSHRVRACEDRRIIRESAVKFAHLPRL